MRRLAAWSSGLVERHGGRRPWSNGAGLVERPGGGPGVPVGKIGQRAGGRVRRAAPVFPVGKIDGPVAGSGGPPGPEAAKRAGLKRAKRASPKRFSI